MRATAPFPKGLKVGDFIQTVNHFSDVYFEVLQLIEPRDGSDFWMITYAQYDKHSCVMRSNWINRVTEVRKVIPAEMAIPVMLHKRARFHSAAGRYEPFEGFRQRMDESERESPQRERTRA